MKKTILIVFLVCTAFVQKTNSCFADNQCKKSEKRPVLVSLNYDDLLKNKQNIKAGKPEVMVAYKKLISIFNLLLNFKNFTIIWLFIKIDKKISI